ncbi:AI-2E family transporter [Pseudogulbenkiania ferrooxidans]|uniref:Permease n=1 Tax=Pseudogulbenkiania ferrooxidans 2002 TaxID=279714 RepID=B9Z577_9NEIS|nr:AI-2E family transporter [Pseudogulbenkiania ferrooxidans]EEG08309.1 protein of unknown function UPF0118 [Pseudogulbenkiania ferrooxidans 2002]
MLDKGFAGIGVMAVLRVAIVALLVWACLQVILPFLGALTWAVIIAISAWPLYQRLTQCLRGRGNLAALLVVLLLGLALAVPLGLMVLTLTDTLPHLNGIAHGLANFTLPPPPAWLGKIPLTGEALTQYWVTAQTDLPGLLARLKPWINQGALWLLGRGAMLGVSLLEIVMAIIVAGLLLANGEALWRIAERVINKLGGASASELPQVVARTIRGVTTGVVGTALAQTILCVIGLLIAGVPGALALGFLCFVIAVAQLPTLLVWLPAAGWVFYTGATGMGVFLLLWGFLLVNTIDNVLKPLLISQGAKLPLSLIFLGVIGGLLAWGIIGLFIGPTLLAIGFTLFQFWLNNDEEAEAKPEHR